jgi:hypothetical protein
MHSSLIGDFDNDCDIDGYDLAGHFLKYGLFLDILSLQDFAANYGTSFCP